MKNRFFFGFECKLLCFLLACVTSVGCFAQSKIEGFVMEKEGQPLHGANVLLVCSDSLVAAVTTQTKGEFVLQPDTGKYTLVVSHMGYETNRQNVVLTVSGIKLSPIHLTKSVMELGGVEIAAEQELYETERNKTIVRIPSSVKKAALDIYSVLSSVPALDVNSIEKDVSLLGSKNSIVMVNNIRRDRGYLLNIKPENIDKVEIIRSPSMRYAIKEIDGIINIVTKEPVTGVNGYLMVSEDVLLKNGYQMGGMTYTAPKFSVSMGIYNFNMNEKNKHSSIIRDIKQDDGWLHTEKRTKSGTYKTSNPTVSTAIDYNHSKKSYSSLALSYSNSNSSSSNPYDFLQMDASETARYSMADERQKTIYQTAKANLYHQTKWNEIHMLSADINYNLIDNNSKTRYREYGQDGVDLFKNNQSNISRTNNLDGQVNVEHKWKSITLEEGARFYWVKNNYSSSSNTVNSRKSVTDYDEIRSNLYVNVLGDINKHFSYQLGLFMDIVRMDVPTIKDPIYTKLNPAAFLRYKINNKQNLTFDYKRTYQRPSFQALNPISYSIDSIRFIVGNPGLIPSSIDRIRFSYELTLNPIFIWASLQYRFAKDNIAQYEYLNDNGKYIITYANAARRSGPAFELTANLRPFRWWNIGVYGWITYLMYEDKNNSQFNKNLWEPELRITSSINIKKFSSQIYLPIPLRTRTLTGYTQNTLSTYLNCYYSINKNLGITANIRHILPLKFKSVTGTDSYKEDYRSGSLNDRFFNVSVGVSYSFSKGISSVNKQKKKGKSFEESASGEVQTY